MIGRIAAGFAAGLFWFLVLSVLEGAREQYIGNRPGVPYLLLALAGATAVVAVILLASAGSGFRVGVIAGLGISMLLGLIETPYVGTASGQTLFAIPTIFSRGLASMSVWVALGVTGALTAVSLRGLSAEKRPVGR